MKLVKKEMHMYHYMNKYSSSHDRCNNLFLKLRCAFLMMSNPKSITEIVGFFVFLEKGELCISLQ